MRCAVSYAFLRAARWSRDKMPFDSPFSPRPRVLDLDGSLLRQSDFLRCSRAQVVSLASAGAGLRYLCRRDRRQNFERRLAAKSSPADRHRLTFYGSGDFHHLSFSLLKRFSRPLSVIVFDQHPDWDATSPFPCCGTWVGEALRLPHVQRVIVLGAGSEDLGGAQLWRGHRAALACGRLEIFPATLGRSLWPVLRPQTLASGQRSGAWMKWNTLERVGWEAALAGVIARLPTSDIYISVDKDCLREREAISNWDAGELALPDVCVAIERLRRERNLVGADVTGEWSGGAPANAFFRAVSRADHPPRFAPDRAELERNEVTNLALWKAFGGHE